ncbi:hypothetical protein ACTFJW_08970 [Clostridium cagae]
MGINKETTSDELERIKGDITNILYSAQENLVLNVSKEIVETNYSGN